MNSMFGPTYRGLFSTPALPATPAPLTFTPSPNTSMPQGGSLATLLAVAAPYVTSFFGNRTSQAATRQASLDAQRAAEMNRQMQESVLAQQARLEEERNRMLAEQFAVQQQNTAAQLAEQQRQWELTYGMQKARQDFEMEELNRRRAAAEPYRQQVAQYLASPGPSIIAR
jgi:hypothetical protein